MKKITLTFWGVRGSLARPGIDTCIYGGNTSCVEISTQNHLIICDTGTGIYNLGKKIGRKKIEASILFSHYHWDHMIGFPFFGPLYNKESKLTLIGRKGLKKGLNNLLQAPNFPVRLTDFDAKISLREINLGKFTIADVTVDAFEVNHPNGAFGYNFLFQNGKKVSLITDAGQSKDDKELVRNISGADILIHDAQYLPDELIRRRKFGHSSYPYVIDLAKRAEVKNIILFHHDPSRSDKQVKIIEESSKKFARKIEFNGRIAAAREGMKIILG